MTDRAEKIALSTPRIKANGLWVILLTDHEDSVNDAYLQGWRDGWDKATDYVEEHHITLSKRMRRGPDNV
jgi:hypothetical protein